MEYRIVELLEHSELKMRHEEGIIEMKKKKTEEIIVIFVMYAVICIFLLYFQHRIIGPAIALDEMDYFNMGRDLHESGNFSGSQYAILYPFTISFAFFADKLTKTYDIIKLLNILLMASSIVPSYLISKKMISNRIICYILAFVVSMLPWSATALLIVAEPLFYPLSLWGSLFFFEFIDKKRSKDIVKLAILCGLLYLTKQGGLVFIVAVEITLIFDYFNNNKKNIIMYLVSIIANIVPSLLMMLFNKLRGQAAMGYAGETSRYMLALHHPLMVLKMIIYQFSDVMLMSYFIFFIIFFISILNIKKETKENQSKYIMIALWTSGIILLSALHRAPVNGELLESNPLTFSRYTCVVIPLILIVATKQIMEHTIRLKWAIIGSVIGAICCIAFSPVSSAVYSYGFINSFGLSYMSDFVYGLNRIHWSKETVSIFYTVFLVLFFLSISIFILNKNIHIKSIGLSLFAIFSIWTGVEATRFAYKVCVNQNTINAVYRYLVDFDIQSDEFIFDEEVLEGNHSITYYNYMWYGELDINDDENTAQYLITKQEYLYELVFSTSDGYMIYKVE